MKENFLRRAVRWLQSGPLRFRIALVVFIVLPPVLILTHFIDAIIERAPDAAREIRLLYRGWWRAMKSGRPV